MHPNLVIAAYSLALVGSCAAFYNNLEPATPYSQGASVEDLENRWSVDWGFSGISTFAHLNYTKCLVTPDEIFDIAILGVPFDTAVSYRPGARFDPRAIRAASSRQTSFRGFNHRAGLNPYTSWPRILDCGDIPVTPFDNALAIYQMTSGYLELLSREPTSAGNSISHKHPKIITLSGDHSVALPALRALNRVYQTPISILHYHQCKSNRLVG